MKRISLYASYPEVLMDVTLPALKQTFSGRVGRPKRSVNSSRNTVEMINHCCRIDYPYLQLLSL